MTIKVIFQTLWILLGILAAISGWRGKFPFSWLVGIFSGYLLFSAFEKSLAGWIAAITILAFLPGGISAVKEILDTVADTRIRELKMAPHKISEIDPHADITKLGISCGTLEVKSLQVAALHGLIAAYINNPIIGWAGSLFLPTNEKNVSECINHIIAYRDSNQDLFKTLERTWENMPEEIKINPSLVPGTPQGR